MAAEKSIVLAARAVRIESGQGVALELGPDRSYALVSLDVDAFSGPDDSAKLDVKIETAAAQVGNYTEIYSASVTAPSAQLLKLVDCDRWLRASWTLTASLSTSFAISGTSYQMYANALDVAATSLPKKTLDAIPADILAAAGLVATDEAASYLAKSRTLPLVSWTGALRLHVANMTAYHAMKRRGFDPDTDKLIRMGYDDAIAWLKGPGAANDPGIIDSTPTQSALESFMVSRPERGWAHR